MRPEPVVEEAESGLDCTPLEQKLPFSEDEPSSQGKAEHPEYQSPDTQIGRPQQVPACPALVSQLLQEKPLIANLVAAGSAKLT